MARPRCRDPGTAGRMAQRAGHPRCCPGSSAEGRPPTNRCSCGSSVQPCEPSRHDMTGRSVDRGVVRALTDGRLALATGLMLVVLLGLGLAPTIAREETRDWVAYQRAADRLSGNQPLYAFDPASPYDEPYLYPPATAAVWRWFG